MTHFRLQQEMHRVEKAALSHLKNARPTSLRLLQKMVDNTITVREYLELKKRLNRYWKGEL